MKIQYFEDTDTLYIEFQGQQIVETRDLDENTLLDLDSAGNIGAITVEHASQRADIRHLQVEGIAAQPSPLDGLKYY
jgi:uncharacterized protein YuzE